MVVGRAENWKEFKRLDSLVLERPWSYLHEGSVKIRKRAGRGKSERVVKKADESR